MEVTQQYLQEQIQKAVEAFWSNDDRDTLPQVEPQGPLGAYCDHSVLRAYTRKETLKAFCQEAIQYGAASVAVCPANIRFVSENLKGSGVLAGCAVGFPLGNTTSEVKAFEAAQAVDNGAGEVDMVIHIGALKDKDYLYVYRDIKGVVDAVRAKKADFPVKVILETCYLTDDEKIAVCVLAREAGADYVKTSTGMGTGGATVEDVKLMRKVVGDTMKIKAASDVLTQEDALKMIHAGAQRLGISRLPQIVTGDNDCDSASKHNKVK